MTRTAIETPNREGAVAVRIVGPGELTSTERERMFQLMDDHFENIDRAQFEADLEEKRWVITITDSTGILQGFSTQGILATRIDGRDVHAFFTGDTALAPAYWGEAGWIRAGARLAISVAEQIGGPFYWLALTSTHRTYRFLPAFWKAYYPAPDVTKPPEVQRTLDSLVRSRYPADYDPASGIVRNPTPVRAERRDMASTGFDSRYDLFFRERNPRFLEGDYLACILELSRDNLTRLGRRVIDG